MGRTRQRDGDECAEDYYSARALYKGAPGHWGASPYGGGVTSERRPTVQTLPDCESGRTVQSRTTKPRNDRRHATWKAGYRATSAFMFYPVGCYRQRFLRG